MALQSGTTTLPAGLDGLLAASALQAMGDTPNEQPLEAARNRRRKGGGGQQPTGQKAKGGGGNHRSRPEGSS